MLKQLLLWFVAQIALMDISLLRILLSTCSFLLCVIEIETSSSRNSEIRECACR